jgi:hypothetical protein
MGCAQEGEIAKLRASFFIAAWWAVLLRKEPHFPARFAHPFTHISEKIRIKNIIAKEEPFLVKKS